MGMSERSASILLHDNYTFRWMKGILQFQEAYRPTDVICIDVVGARDVGIAVKKTNKGRIKGQNILIAIFVQIVGLRALQTTPGFGLKRQPSVPTTTIRRNSHPNHRNMWIFYAPHRLVVA